MEKNKLIIYCDGASRGNPGPAGIGTVVGEREYSQAIGRTTNNVAEYRAAIFGLKKAKQLLGAKKAAQAELEMRMDSELLHHQLIGEYKLKDKDLIPLFVEIWNLKQDFKRVEFIKVPREQNRRADALANRAFDSLL
jgi:ribonuclease HI